jgi:hypothetical protein
MTNLAVKFLSAVSVGIVASAPIAMIPLSARGAAEECLTTLKDETPAGKHWYYRSERGTKRHCWYLRDEGETSSQTTTSRPARRAAPEVAPDRAAKLARSAADAHAELPLPQTLVEADVNISPTTPAPSVDPRGAGQKLPEKCLPRDRAVASGLALGRANGLVLLGHRTADITFVRVSVGGAGFQLERERGNVPPVAPTKVETSAMGTPASLQMLLLGIAVSWLTGSAIYLMARIRRRSQRSIKWNLPASPTEEPTNHTGIPPWHEPMIVNSTRRGDAGRDAGGQSLERQRSGLGDNAREIEQLLARFADPAQAEP